MVLPSADVLMDRAVAAADTVPPVGDPVVRMLDATMTCLSRFGVAKTTIDDIAREAGCSRATVYRYFANRHALVIAAVDREIEVLTEAVTGAGAAESTLEDAIVAMFLTAARRITAHDALQRALELEPEVVLPSLSFEGGDRTLAEATVRFAPVLAPYLPADRAARAAEWCTRVLLAYLHPDRAPLSMTDDAAVRALVQRHLIPALSLPSTSKATR
jgi:AcrR family transcriptional regulator